MSQDRLSLENETIRICQELIRIPSVNYGEGKGDESAVAAYVVASRAEVGVAATIYESAPNRANVIAKISGSDSSRPGLVLHGHIDVVPADAKDWSIDPFSGEIKDGFIWGRGAVDMKNVDAMILAIVRKWAREGYVPPRDIVLAFFGDEEAGSEFGSRYMTANHPEVFAGCTEAVSEVGGFSITVKNGKRLYFIETAQKGIHWIKLTAKGTAGHGSMINKNNAVTALSEAVAKIGNHNWPQRYTKTIKSLFANLAKATDTKYDETDFRPMLDELGPAAKMFGATLQNTANPTMLNSGYSLEVDFSGDLVEAMVQALIAEDPDAIAVPYMMSGGTDNKALSELGIVGYGFAPLKLPANLDFMALFHGVDERVPLDGLKSGVHMMEHFLKNS